MVDLEGGRARKEFDLHVEHLTETHKAFVESTGKVAGFLLIALGWFATSKDARMYLASEPQISQLAAVAVVVAYFLSAGASWVAYRVSEKTVRQLVALEYLPKAAFENRRLGLPTFLFCVAGTGVLAAVLALALLTASSP